MPASEIVGELGASLTRAMLPIAAPRAVGANCTVKLALWPGVSVNGRVRAGVMLNAAPVTFAAVTVKFDPPVLLRVMDCVLAAPTVTSPKLRLVGFAVSWLPAGVMPLPERLRMVGGFVASLVTVTFPVEAPAASGENATVKVTLWLGANVRGLVGAVAVKPAPVTLIRETERSAFPVLVRLMGRETVFPTSTSPKDRLEGFKVARGAGLTLPMVKIGLPPGGLDSTRAGPPLHPVANSSRTRKMATRT